MSAISWTYPQDALLALRAGRAVADDNEPVDRDIAVSALNFSYTISGDKPSWRPVRAFDDGRQTFIAFPASIAVGEAPPLFIRGAKGEAELVNYRREDARRSAHHRGQAGLAATPRRTKGFGAQALEREEQLTWQI